MEADWNKTFNNIKCLHDLTFKSVDDAIKLEEQEKPRQAVEKYKEAITFIDQSMNVHVTYPEDEDEIAGFHEACKMIQKLKKTKSELTLRIDSLEKSESQNSHTITYAELAEELNNLDSQAVQATNTYVIFTTENARVYYVDKEGSVLSNSESQRLVVFGTDGDVPNKFLQINEWVYPLVPGVSPCFKSEFGAFMFPDINTDQKIGIVLPEDEAPMFYDLLTNILEGVIVEHPEIVEGFDEKLSSKIAAGAKFLADGIVSSSTRIGNFLDHSIQPPPPKGPPKNIPAYVQSGAKITEATTSKTAQVVGFVADKVGIATSKLGQYLAPHIQAQGTKLLQSTFQYSEEEASKKVKSILTITGGAVAGLATVYYGLETAAGILGNSLKDNTVKVIESKYGHPAGDVALSSMNTVGNVFTINHEAKKCLPIGIVKQTVKNTGKAVINTQQ
nr:protein spartin [Onthophagus taurus]